MAVRWWRTKEGLLGTVIVGASGINTALGVLANIADAPEGFGRVIRWVGNPFESLGAGVTQILLGAFGLLLIWRGASKVA
jgi:hypothetical protein